MRFFFVSLIDCWQADKEVLALRTIHPLILKKLFSKYVKDGRSNENYITMYPSFYAFLSIKLLSGHVTNAVIDHWSDKH